MYHWNVTGPSFHSLHLMFEEQYLELRDAVDVIAERIRALGSFAPGSYSEFARLSSVPDEEGVPAAEEMIRRLGDGHELLVRAARPLGAKAEEAGRRGDRGSGDATDHDPREDGVDAAEQSRLIAPIP